MAPLLEVLLTFAATMLVLALAAQSLQNIVKFTFAIKAWTRPLANTETPCRHENRVSGS